MVTNYIGFFLGGGGRKTVIQPLSRVAQQVAVQDQRIHEGLIVHCWKLE